MANTGETILNNTGTFPACAKRQSICGYACCKFGSGNWIMLLPGEYEQAQQQNLKRDHLTFDNPSHAICHSPCHKGDLKPIDCSWYPLFPANIEATQFLVADHRKCPIPNTELFDKMREVHAAALLWEQNNPGSLEQIITLSKDFVGYMPFPYKIENNDILLMNDEELKELMINNSLPANYVCQEWLIDAQGYSATGTPDDKE
ncbi:MAG: hypothetical protein K9L22_08475 [Methylococcaceae bacterium]|nr:hypothetical protein [Methylococcaceae bacterium]